MRTPSESIRSLRSGVATGQELYATSSNGYLAHASRTFPAVAAIGYLSPSMEAAAVVYPRFTRGVVAVLVAISRASPLALLAALLFFQTRLDNPLRLMRAFSGFCLLPGIVAWLIQAACDATLRIEDGTLTLEQRRRRIELPCASVDRVVPWKVALPAGGVWLRLRSGRRFPYGVQIADPVAVIESLTDAGAPAYVRAASQEPAARYSAAKSSVSRRWYHPLLKYVVFALVPAVPLFRLHQWIAYGGTFGEYYTYGLEAYLLGFFVYWGTLTIDLVMYAAALRLLAEAVALPAAYFAPSHAAQARRLAEIAHLVLYYCGVPVLLLRHFFSS